MSRAPASAGGIERLDHVVIAVRDRDTAAETCARLLGRRPSWRGAHPELGTRNALFRLENTYLELLAPGGEGPVGKLLGERLERDGEGPLALAFGTDDLDACVKGLRARGLTAADPAPGRGCDEASGAERRWRFALLPERDTRGVGVFVLSHDRDSAELPEAKPTENASAAVSALDHVVVTTADADAAKRLYGEGLGLRCALDKSFPQWGARLVFFRVSGLTVELAARLGEETSAATPDRFWGISYRTPDVPAARARLAAAGFDVSPVRPGRRPGTRVCTVRGEPLGVATLVIGPDEGAPA